LVTIDANDKGVENPTDHEEEAKKQRSQKIKRVKDESHRNSKQESDQEFLMKLVLRVHFSLLLMIAISQLYYEPWMD
jgi:hypothetical protein